MKQILLLVAGLLMCLCSSQAKNKVIEEPPFCVRNTTSIEVSKVTLSDTATVLSIYAKYRPKNWIKIASGSYLKDNNGETYLLRSGIGITPDKEFWMPESGEAEFQLVFPPLPASATSIDFTEGADVENGFSIWGIQLKGKKLPELVLPKDATVHAADKNAPLPEPLLKYGNATLKGKLLDYRPGMAETFTINLAEAVKGYGTQVEINVQPDGSFSSNFPVMGTTAASLWLSGTSIRFFVEPEQTTELYINQRELSRRQSKFHRNGKAYGKPVYVAGPLAYVAQELSENTVETDLMANYTALVKEVEDMDVAAYKAHFLEKMAATQQQINKLPLSPATKELLVLESELSTIQVLNYASYLMTQAYLQKNKLPREEGRQYSMDLQKKLPEDFLPASLGQKLNVPQASLSVLHPISMTMTMYLKDKLIPVWGTDKGVFFDIANAAKYYRGIADFNPLTDEQKVALNSLPAAYKEMLEKANEELLAQIEANKKKSGFTINETGEVSNEDLFASIISKFRGKGLLVDFWATWCGPCRMANKVMVPMKEELKDKDIVYLYIAGENSPQKVWENMIANIHGEHYRVTGDQWKYLSDSFKIEGVPTYLIIDRHGDIKYKQTGFPGVAKIKEELLKVTDK